MRLAIKTPRRRNDADARLIPLINIVFLMLIFFMVAGQISRARDAGAAQLPSSSLVHPAEHRDAVLVVEADGELQWRGAALANDDLAAVLANFAAESSAAPLQLCLDRHLPAETLSPVLRELRKAGLHKVELVTLHKAAL